MDGVTRWYCEVQGEIVFEESKEQAIEKYGFMDVDPIPFVFYSANVHDNPWVAKYQPRYISKLRNLPPVERARLYEGCWYATEETSGYFKREWCEVISPKDVDLLAKRARAWDRAASLPSEAYPDPDWTVGIKGYLEEDGTVVIEDAFRMRDRPAKVIQKIKEIGSKDGKSCLIGIPQDAGGAGKESAEMAYTLLLQAGLSTLINKARANKLARFEPFAIAAQNGKVKVVEGDWNKWFFDELERFDGLSKSRRKYHDDVADSCSDLFQMLTKNKFFVNINPSKKHIQRDTKLIGLRR